MTKEEKKQIREAVANYMYSEGCSCCQDVDAHKEHEKILAKILVNPILESTVRVDCSPRTFPKSIRIVVGVIANPSSCIPNKKENNI